MDHHGLLYMYEYMDVYMDVWMIVIIIGLIIIDHYIMWIVMDCW